MSTEISFNCDDVLIAKDKDNGKEYYVIINQDEQGCAWIQDECPLGHLITWHRRYSIGEKHDYEYPQDLWKAIIMNRYGYSYNEPIDPSKKKFKEYVRLLLDYSGVIIKKEADDDGTFVYYLYFEDEDGSLSEYYYNLSTDDPDKFTREDEDILWGALDELTERELHRMVDNIPEVCCFPVFMYDHSGIALSISNAEYPFNDRWDSGQLGWWYITKEEAAKEGWTDDKWKLSFLKCIKSYIKEFNEIESGNCWGFVCAEKDLVDERIAGLSERNPYRDRCLRSEISANQTDSCWGYVGDYEDLVKDYCSDQHLEITGVLE